MSRPKGSKNKSKAVADSVISPVPEFTSTVTPESEKGYISTKLPPPAFRDRAALLKELATDHREARDVARQEEGEEIISTSFESNTADEETLESEPSLEEAAQEANQAAHEETPDADHTDAEKSLAPAPVETSIEIPKTRKIKVRGEEVEFTEDKIIEEGLRALSKQSEADRRLQEATELRRLAQSRAHTLPSGSSPEGGQPRPPAIADAAAISKALLSGDEDAVTNAVARLLGSGRQVSDLAQDLTTRAHGQNPAETQRLVMEGIAYYSATEAIKKPVEQGGFADLLSDPLLKSEFERREDLARRAGDTRSYLELYQSIGKELRDWRDGVVKQFTPKTGLENREARKAQATTVAVNGGKPPTLPGSPPPKTHDQKLEDMRRTRGLN